VRPSYIKSLAVGSLGKTGRSRDLSRGLGRVFVVVLVAALVVVLEPAAVTGPDTEDPSPCRLSRFSQGYVPGEAALVGGSRSL
jgi:hypothetical protein